ncbi:hypothetical protein [Streptomyces sp. CAU 1734]
MGGRRGRTLRHGRENVLATLVDGQKVRIPATVGELALRPLGRG